jgi:hypothetical protein
MRVPYRDLGFHGDATWSVETGPPSTDGWPDDPPHIWLDNSAKSRADARRLAAVLLNPADMAETGERR